MRLIALTIAIATIIGFASCGDDEVIGCTDPSATNYNPDATTSDGSCIILGCMDETADNYNPNATESDGNCIFSGCTDPEASNYNPNATVDSGNCLYPGCTDIQCDQYDETANDDDGSCSTYFDRWTGTFAGDFDCNGELLDPYFGEAVMTFSKVDEPANLDSMEVYIEFTLSDLPLNFGATITRDSMYADAFFEGVVVDSIDLIPNVDEVYNISLHGVLGINDANDNVTGILQVFVEETASGLNVMYNDQCTFDGYKQ